MTSTSNEGKHAPAPNDADEDGKYVAGDNSAFTRSTMQLTGILRDNHNQHNNHEYHVAYKR